MMVMAEEVSLCLRGLLRWSCTYRTVPRKEGEDHHNARNHPYDDEDDSVGMTSGEIASGGTVHAP